jgi:predicted esterase
MTSYFISVRQLIVLCAGLFLISLAVFLNVAHLVHDDEHPLSISAAENTRLVALHAILKPFHKLPSAVVPPPPSDLPPPRIVANVPGQEYLKFGRFRQLHVSLDRSLLLFEPRSLAQRSKAGHLVTVPLLLLFHDANQSAWQLALYRSNWARLAARFEFVAAFLQADVVNADDWHIAADAVTTARWKTAFHVQVTDIHDDVAYVSTVLDELLVALHVDRRQIFAIGYGDGATFLARAALFFHHTLASICLVGGGLDEELSPSPSDFKRVPSVFVLTKADDKQRPIAEAAHNEYRRARAETRLLELPKAESLTTLTLAREDDIFVWLRKHQRSST